MTAGAYIPLQTGRSLRLWFVLAVSLVCFGAGLAYESFRDWKQLLSHEAARLRFAAEMIGSNVQTEVVRADRLLQTMVSQASVWRENEQVGRSPSVKLGALGRVIGSQERFFVVDANGTVLASTQEDMMGQSTIDHDFFQIARISKKRDRLLVIKGIPGRADEQGITLVRQRVDSKGAFAGAVVTTLSGLSLWGNLASISPALDVSILLLHPDLGVLAALPVARADTFRVVSEPGSFLDLHLGSKERTHFFTGPWRSITGDELVVLRTIDGASSRPDDAMVVAVAREDSVVFSEWRRDLKLKLLLFSLSTLVSTIWMWLYQQRRVIFLQARASHDAERLQAEAKLRESHARLNSIVNSAFESIISIDESGRILMFNEAAVNMFQCAQAEALGSDISRFIPERFRTAHQWHVTRFSQETVLTRPMGKTHEIFGFRANGEEFPIQAAISKTIIQEQVVMTVLMTDITQRKAREQALAESEQRFRNIVESTEGIVWEADARTFGFTFVSHKAEALLGFPVTDWYQPGFWVSHLHPEDKAWALDYCATWSQQLQPHNFEYRFVAKDGRTVWLHDIVTVVAENGEPRWLRGLMIDVTTQKMSAQALADSEARLKSAEKMAHLGNWTLHWPTGRMQWSDEVFRLFELDADAVQCTYATYLSVLHPDDRVMFDQANQQSWTDKTPLDIQYRLLMKDRRIKFVRSHIDVVHSPDGQSTRSRGTVQDVTARQRAAEALIELNASLEQRVAQRTQELEASNLATQKALSELKKTQDELVQREKLASLGSLVAGVAHELNTPLGNSITIGSSLQSDFHAFLAKTQDGKISRAQMDDFLSKSNKGFDLLMHSLGRTTKLVGDFKQVAVDQSSEERRPFDLAETVGQIVDSISPRFKHTPHRIDLDIRPGIKMESYPGPLGQVISNLAINALVHGFDDSRHGVVRITADTAVAGRVQLLVIDNGKGIPEENLGRIFEPFFTTRLGRGGSGLGLHVVYNIVAKTLGGHIFARSKPNESTEFVVDIPCCAPNEQPRNPKVRSERHGSTSGS